MSTSVSSRSAAARAQKVAMETRVCPGCKIEKEYPAKNECCTIKCSRNWAAEKAAGEAVEVDPVEEHRDKRRIRELQNRLRKELDTKSRGSDLDDFMASCLTRPLEIPEWTYNPRIKRGAQHTIPTAFFSDSHFGEVVEPEQVEWLNCYNREIQYQRLRRFTNNTIKLARHYTNGFVIDGLVLPLGGDIFSGDIHEELAKSNEGTIQEEMLAAIEPMCSMITALADEFGSVYIPCVPGNHPRGTRKPVAKMRAPNNFDWMFYHLLARFLKDDKRLTWAITRAADVNYKTYGWRTCLTHGDQFRGGSGIAAEFSPMMIGNARKSERARQADTPYNYLVMGHWHRRNHFNNIVVNGSTKGYDEYAYVMNFPYAPPVQSFWLTDAKYGITIEAPIFVRGDDEKWLKDARARKSELVFDGAAVVR